MSQRTYVAIDLKSYYASLETIERGLDPLTTNLVVADPSRTAKTICLAVSPRLKKLRDSRPSAAVPGDPEGKRNQCPPAPGSDSCKKSRAG